MCDFRALFRVGVVRGYGVGNRGLGSAAVCGLRTCFRVGGIRGHGSGDIGSGVGVGALAGSTGCPLPPFATSEPAFALGGLYVYTHTHLYAYIYIYTYMYMYTYVYLCIYVMGLDKEV